MPLTPFTFVRKFAVAGVLLTPLFSCSPEPASAPENDAAAEELGPNASIIRSPVDGNRPEVDTSQTARMTFSGETDFYFGEVNEGTVVRHEFAFTNTGHLPLLITKARSTCGCTVPQYPEAPIPPGETGVISVAFDTKNKFGRQRKPVTITANTYPAATVVYVSGTVIKN